MEEKSMMLLRELKENLTQIFTSDSVKENRPLRDSGMTNSLLLSLENIICFGLKTSPFLSFFNGPTTPWPWIEGLPDSLPNTDALMADIAASCGSVSAPFAKVRLFLRFSLNSGTIHDCLQALCWNKPLCENNFEPYAIVRDPNMQFAFLSRLEPLEVIQFELETLSIAPILARSDYWKTVDFSAAEKKEVKAVVVTRKNRYQKKKVTAEAAAAAAEVINKAQQEAQQQQPASEAAPVQAPSSEQKQPEVAKEQTEKPAETLPEAKEKTAGMIIEEKRNAAEALLNDLRKEDEKRREIAAEVAKKVEEQARIQHEAEEAARKKREEQERIRLAAEYVEEESMLTQWISEMDNVRNRWEQQLAVEQQNFEAVVGSS